MRFCPYCGSQVSEDDKFCHSCGATLDEMQRESERTTMVQQPVRTDRKGWAATILIVAMILAAAVGGVLLLTNGLPGKETKTIVAYEWDYFYDDTSKHYTYKLEINDSDFEKATNSKIDRSGSESNYNFTTKDKKVHYAVSEYIVVDDYVKKVADDLKAMYNADFPISSPMGWEGFVASFVQGAFTYQLDKDQYGKDEYWAYPLQTLYSKKGDCEDTSILMAALLDAGGADAGIFLVPNHAMTALKNNGTLDVSKTRFGYCMIESTASNNEKFKIGECNNEVRNVYFHLYTGSTNVYV